MKVFNKIVDLQNELFSIRKEGKRLDWFRQWELYMMDMHLLLIEV